MKRGDKFKLTIEIAGQLNRETEATVGVMYRDTFEVVFKNVTGNVLVSERFYTDSLRHVPRRFPTGHEYSLSRLDGI